MKSLHKILLRTLERPFMGRINRLQFLYATLILYALMLVLYILWFVLALSLATQGVPFWLLYIALGVLIVIPAFLYYGVLARRLQDAGWSGLWALTVNVPILGLVIPFVGFFTPSKKEQNLHGLPPEKKRGIADIIFNQKPREGDTASPVLSVLYLLLIVGVLFGVLALFTHYTTPHDLV